MDNSEYALTVVFYLDGKCFSVSSNAIVRHIVGASSYFLVDPGESISCDTIDAYNTYCNAD